MTFQVVHQPHPTPAQSPYRVVQHETGREVIWANRFLDRECIRCLAETTLRSYALDALERWRGWRGHRLRTRRGSRLMACQLTAHQLPDPVPSLDSDDVP